MRLPVTESGVTLPKAWFGEATEVEVRREGGHLTVEAASPTQKSIQPYAPDDPIWQLGGQTSDLEINDASVNLDAYVYGNRENR